MKYDDKSYFAVSTICQYCLNAGHMAFRVCDLPCICLERFEGTGDVHTRFGLGDLRERDHLKDIRVNWRTILKWIFK